MSELCHGGKCMEKKDFRYLGVIFILVIALGIVSLKYKDQSTKQANKCYQMFELLLEAADE